MIAATTPKYGNSGTFAAKILGTSREDPVIFGA
jgi:hypothetical protein